MDERRLRYPAGSNGDGTTHRVGLTRHCLASGAVQLPFALRDSLPEGDLLAYDVIRDETVVLASEPPRRLSGLEAFFAAHELQVNDQLELRLHGGEVRIAPRPRQRRDEATSEAPAPRRASRWTSRLDPAPASEAPPLADRPDVVERIGSVTVRRLGADALTAPPESSLPDPAPSATPQEAETWSRPEAEPSSWLDGDEDLDALLVMGSDRSEAAAPTDATAPGEAAPEAAAAEHAAPAEDDAPAHDAPADDAGMAPDDPTSADAPTSDPEPSEDARRERATATRSEVARALPRPGTVQQGALFGQAPSEPPRRARRGRAPHRPPASRPGPVEAPHVREQDLADPTWGAQVAPAARPRSTDATPADATPTDVPQADVTQATPAAETAQAAPHAGTVPAAPAAPPSPAFAPLRGEPRAERPAERPAPRPIANPTGDERRDADAERTPPSDLQRRVVRWLLEPDTPVIVPYERVQERFDLGADRTRDVLGAILETPPPTLRLTLLREGMLRVSRVTVEQEA